MPDKAITELESAKNTLLDSIAQHFMLPVVGKNTLPELEVSTFVRDLEEILANYRKKHDALVDAIGPAERRLRGKPGGGNTKKKVDAPKSAADVRAMLEGK